MNEELGYFEPRPWHRDHPQKPKVWAKDPSASNLWGIMPTRRNAPVTLHPRARGLLSPRRRYRAAVPEHREMPVDGVDR